MKEAIEIASIQPKPACTGFRNTGGIGPGFGIKTQFLNFGADVIDIS
jgi:hypothetical protein